MEVLERVGGGRPGRHQTNCGDMGRRGYIQGQGWDEQQAVGSLRGREAEWQRKESE